MSVLSGSASGSATHLSRPGGEPQSARGGRLNQCCHQSADECSSGPRETLRFVSESTRSRRATTTAQVPRNPCGTRLASRCLGHLGGGQRRVIFQGLIHSLALGLRHAHPSKSGLPFGSTRCRESLRFVSPLAAFIRRLQVAALCCSALVNGPYYHPDLLGCAKGKA